MPRIIITGGTKGIGKSLVYKFASEGFEIVTCARNKDELNALKKNIDLNYKQCVIHTFVCDVSIKKDLINFGQNAIRVLGTPDVLINNVGIFLPGKIADEEENIFEYQMNVNLAAAYHLTRVILPGMMEQKKGYIFNFCSTASIMAYSNGGSYCISKFGMLGFSKVLREELKEHGIRVSAILPGATDTSSWEGTDLPKERFMNPEDVAKLIYEFYKTPITMNIEEIILRPFKGDII